MTIIGTVVAHAAWWVGYRIDPSAEARLPEGAADGSGPSGSSPIASVSVRPATEPTPRSRARR